MRLIIIIFYVIIIVIIIIEVSLSTMLTAYEAILIRVLLLSISRKKAVVFWKNFQRTKHSSDLYFKMVEKRPYVTHFRLHSRFNY